MKEYKMEGGVANKVTGGIYCIRNIHNNKRYIGQAIDIPRRWSKHQSNLANVKHENSYLQRSYDKYGSESFEYSILVECRNEYLNVLEITLIRNYQTFTDKSKGYNLTKGGDGFKGEHSAEAKQKMRESRRDLFNSPKGELLKQKMSEARQGDKNYMYGKRGADTPRYGKTHSDETKKKMRESTGLGAANPCSRAIIQMEKDGTIVAIWGGIREAERATGVGNGQISACANGRKGYKSAGGYIWKYVEDGKEVIS